MKKYEIMKNRNLIPIIIMSVLTGYTLRLIHENDTLNLSPTNVSTSKYSNRISVQFTPGDACTARIVKHILSAKKEILVQAYSFTSKPIIDALIEQHHKGIHVTIMLDKSQAGSIYALKVANEGMKVYIDKLPGIAHNKVIIIDQEKVFTGSFNFSAAAETKNAENSVLIYDKNIVQAFLINFLKRKQLSTLNKFYQPKKSLK